MAVKNFTLEQIVPNMRDMSIDNIYKTKMNDELSNSKLRLKRLSLRDSIHSMLSTVISKRIRWYHISIIEAKKCQYGEFLR